MSQKGDIMICSIWAGNMPGIYIGAPKRLNHFSIEHPNIEIIIDNKTYFTELTPSFWKDCPEIRVARIDPSFNKLLHWIRKHDLKPPKLSIAEKGKKDTVKLVVVEPYKKFKLSLNE